MFDLRQQIHAMNIGTAILAACYDECYQPNARDDDQYRFQGTAVLQPQNSSCEVSISDRHVIVSSSDKKRCLKISIEDAFATVIESTGSSQGVQRGTVQTCLWLPSDSSKPVPRRLVLQKIRFDGDDGSEKAEKFCHTLLNKREAAGFQQQKKKPLLVIVNPKGGSGQSVYLFETCVKTVFESFKIPYELLCTAYAGHAKQHVEESLLANYSGIVTIGGDGTIYEVLNALFSRSDWQEVRKLPIGVLPGGSGNGLATAIAYAADEYYRRDLFASTLYLLCKGQTQPLDLVLYQTEKRLFCGFLVFLCGFISDVDIESEMLRSLGGLRFQVYGVHRIIFKRTRKARITYLPYDEDETQEESGDQSAADEEFSGQRKFRYLPPLDQPIPADDKRWKVIDLGFFNISIQNRSFLTSDSYVVPEFRRFDPGYMMAFIHSDKVTRWQVVRQMLAFEVIDCPHLQVIKMKAFRFEAVDDNPGLLDVDGERIESGPVQAEVLPKAGRIFGSLRN